ncbi:predicted protein [Chaetomium globosum CBS 148.51]|uniref:Uncharacterized protein n=1 Tax=Chaetomium globosum (strain ATCC 6205 / CBS 148.51 / DSM 1962 / NBRC 6347 / NRRL 1970) TaxID=306901 RepID=Q2H405_CHAGB|nr:uncharacterized protein CHGG_06610 [Chaetomium globosum CBS 148.51]EAQ89991.1 predicted protein [Chaetomium globosum CBS 148.51]
MDQTVGIPRPYCRAGGLRVTELVVALGFNNIKKQFDDGSDACESGPIPLSPLMAMCTASGEFILSAAWPCHLGHKLYR